MKRLSNKEKGFIYWRARGYSLVDSVLKAGYKVKDRIIATKYGSKLIDKVDIIEAIEKARVEIFDKTLITEELILNNLLDIAQNGKVEANRLRASELLGKTKALFIDKTENKTIISEEKKSQINEYIRRLLPQAVSMQ